jgi:hypothetical protein
MAIGVSTTTGFSALLAPDIWEVVVETGREVELIYPRFMNEVDMPFRTVKSQQVAGLGTVPAKPEGSAFAVDAPNLENSKIGSANAYGLALVFSWEAWEDELYGVLRDMAKELARSSRYRMEVDAHTVINNAFNSAYTGYNPGEALCSTSHTSPTTGTVQANRPSPDVGFSISGLQAAMQSFYMMLNDRDLPQAMFPSTVLIDPTNVWAARDILGSSGKPFTADNEANNLIVDNLTYIVDRYLTTTAWFLMAPKGQHGMYFGVRTPPIFDSWDDPWTKNAVFSVFQRHGSWFTDWRGVYGSLG